MPDLRDPVALKRLLSPLLLGIKGVSGIGVPSGRLTVYLESDDDDVRRQVETVMAKAAPDAVPEFVITGAFQAR